MYQHHNSMAFNTKRSNEHLQIWLKTRQLLLNEFQQGTPDQQLLESNKEAILDGFGDFHVILNCLIDNANKEQLTNIHRTLKDVRLNTPKPTLHRSVCHEYDNDKDIDFEGFDLDEARVDSYCCFNELSFVEISCIIDFLPPYCAQRFKNTSRKIAIVVLQEMNKRKVNIFSMNKLMDYECKDVYQLGIATYSSSSRYPQSMTYSTLTDLWSKAYNIPHQNMLIYTSKRYNNALSLLDMQNEAKVQQNNNSNQCLLRIRFTHNTVHGSAYYKSTAKLIGIPYVVACRRGDDLQSVMNRADFDSWIRKNIGTCYVYVESPNSRFGTNLARKSGSYSHLEVFQSIMRGDIHECLVIKLKKQFPE
eukprot:274508_1